MIIRSHRDWVGGFLWSSFSQIAPFPCNFEQKFGVWGLYSIPHICQNHPRASAKKVIIGYLTWITNNPWHQIWDKPFQTCFLGKIAHCQKQERLSEKTFHIWPLLKIGRRTTSWLQLIQVHKDYGKKVAIRWNSFLMITALIPIGLIIATRPLTVHSEVLLMNKE